ncbi:MAG: hypothetical protein SFX18_19905 [Pirellulales bacterium]|nr:hypothetical protein [Pirellulales bacterium]
MPTTKRKPRLREIQLELFPEPTRQQVAAEYTFVAIPQREPTAADRQGIAKFMEEAKQYRGREADPHELPF